MTTDLARMEGNAVAALGTANDALVRLGHWVEAARNANQLVAPLVGTAFIPDAYKPKIDPRATPEQKAEARETAIAHEARRTAKRSAPVCSRRARRTSEPHAIATSGRAPAAAAKNA